MLSDLNVIGTIISNAGTYIWDIINYGIYFQ